MLDIGSLHRGDASGIAADDYAEYLRLIRQGDSESIARAAAIFPAARRDAREVRELLDCLAALSRDDPEARAAEVDALTAELGKVREEITRLQEREKELQHRIESAATPPGPTRAAIASRLKVSRPAVKHACAAEIRAAGF